MTAGVEGLERTTRALRRMGPGVASEIEKALDKGAAEIEARAKAIAPRDTGDMARAIETRKTLDGFTGTGLVGNFARMVRGSAAGLTRFVGVFPASRASPGWYAAFVEFGHANAAAKPFMRPAFFSLKKRVVGRIGRAVNKAVKEVARRG